MRYKLSLGVWLLCITSLSGCAATVADVARKATPASVEGGIEAIADPDLQRKLVRSIDKKRVEQGTRNMTAGMVDGALGTFEDPERKERLAGAVSDAVGVTVDSALTHALSQDNQEQVRTLVRGIASDMVSSSFAAVRSQVGGDEQKQALAHTVRMVTKQATLGFQDAIDEVREKREAGKLGEDEGSVLNAVGKAAEEGDTALIMLGIGAAVFALIVVLTLLWAGRRRKVHREELAQRDGALILLANAIKASEEEPWAPELKKVLRRAARDNDGAQYLRRVLHERPDLRLSEH